LQLAAQAPRSPAAPTAPTDGGEAAVRVVSPDRALRRSARLQGSPSALSAGAEISDAHLASLSPAVIGAKKRTATAAAEISPPHGAGSNRSQSPTPRKRARPPSGSGPREAENSETVAVDRWSDDDDDGVMVAPKQAAVAAPKKADSTVAVDNWSDDDQVPSFAPTTARGNFAARPAIPTTSTAAATTMAGNSPPHCRRQP
jgi:hypothetical protein